MHILSLLGQIYFSGGKIQLSGINVGGSNLIGPFRSSSIRSVWLVYDSGNTGKCDSYVDD